MGAMTSLMIGYFKTSNGVIGRADAPGPKTWTRLAAPTDEEIRLQAASMGVEPRHLSAPLDREETSRWESDETGTYLIVDVPYRASDGSFDTLPLELIATGDRIVSVSSIQTEVSEHFIAQSALTRNIDISDQAGFILRFMYAVSKEYQQDLKEIDQRRREAEKKVYRGIDDTDLVSLHRLETSLVYFITSLKGCNVVLDMMKRYADEVMDRSHKDLLRDVMVENQQNIEMATVYQAIMDSTRELFSSLMNNKLNDVMRWLTAVTIIMSIPMIVSGIYGMNVPIPGQTSEFAFIVLVGGIGVACVGAALWLKRRKLF